MIGKMIGALIGGNIAKQTRGISGPAGAALGAAVPMVLRRMSLPTMIALAAGGFAAKRLSEQSRGETAKTGSPGSSSPSAAI